MRQRRKNLARISLSRRPRLRLMCMSWSEKKKKKELGGWLLLRIIHKCYLSSFFFVVPPPPDMRSCDIYIYLFFFFFFFFSSLLFFLLQFPLCFTEHFNYHPIISFLSCLISPLQLALFLRVNHLTTKYYHHWS
ncbi:hypothetical protein I7I50_01145 [Histoplasma capsulatum G186AR]|nr:hypothetical protein I7I50_01145 [Histoplasma capsulatum G186AR]